ncbi:adenosylcobinamide-GDP ribazoletransferase [Delftia sp. PS-11]|uniref:adenosylcobinamide-GDP ribazoletransferase n=1 Tax=Delftia sp. PS-11 TaxID=2767222 RepID=UPI0024568E46|nr:adenosylcobinamide-GDP ribazoletransferase [Delftia sp. PS-11]KAJ8740817.1 adenosylcobinamide-GDP ribazoletransferase [Delftia sp. PS-11]
MQSLRHFLLAVQFFSRIPVTGRLADWAGWSPALQRASAAHLPGVGWLVGLWGGAWLMAAGWLLAPSAWMPLAAAVAATLATLWLTGGLHEDGLADVADGLGGFATPERALEIMKDSRLGAYGAMALVMALLAKAALLAILAESGTARAALLLCCIHVLSRMAPLVLMRALPYVSLAATAKATHMAGHPLDGKGLATGALWCVPALALPGWLAPAPLQAALLTAGLLLAGALVTATMTRWLRRRLGGMTGDCLGAAQQVSELAMLLAAAAIVLRWPAP